MDNLIEAIKLPYFNTTEEFIIKYIINTNDLFDVLFLYHIQRFTNNYKEFVTEEQIKKINDDYNIYINSSNIKPELTAFLQQNPITKQNVEKYLNIFDALYKASNSFRNKVSADNITKIFQNIVINNDDKQLLINEIEKFINSNYIFKNITFEEKRNLLLRVHTILKQDVTKNELYDIILNEYYNSLQKHEEKKVNEKKKIQIYEPIIFQYLLILVKIFTISLPIYLGLTIFFPIIWKALNYKATMRIIAPEIESTKNQNVILQSNKINDMSESTIIPQEQKSNINIEDGTIPPQIQKITSPETILKNPVGRPSSYDSSYNRRNNYDNIFDAIIKKKMMDKSLTKEQKTEEVIKYISNDINLTELEIKQAEINKIDEELKQIADKKNKLYYESGDKKKILKLSDAELLRENELLQKRLKLKEEIKEDEEKLENTTNAIDDKINTLEAKIKELETKPQQPEVKEKIEKKKVKLNILNNIINKIKHLFIDPEKSKKKDYSKIIEEGELNMFYELYRKIDNEDDKFRFLLSMIKKYEDVINMDGVNPSNINKHNNDELYNFILSSLVNNNPSKNTLWKFRKYLNKVTYYKEQLNQMKKLADYEILPDYETDNSEMFEEVIETSGVKNKDNILNDDVTTLIKFNKPINDESEKDIQLKKENLEIFDEPKEEKKEEPKEEIKEEPKEEIKEEPKEEIKEEPKEEIKEDPFKIISDDMKTKILEEEIIPKQEKETIPKLEILDKFDLEKKEKELTESILKTDEEKKEDINITNNNALNLLKEYKNKNVDDSIKKTYLKYIDVLELIINKKDLVNKIRNDNKIYNLYSLKNLDKNIKNLIKLLNAIHYLDDTYTILSLVEVFKSKTCKMFLYLQNYTNENYAAYDPLNILRTIRDNKKINNKKFNEDLTAFINDDMEENYLLPFIKTFLDYLIYILEIIKNSDENKNFELSFNITENEKIKTIEEDVSITYTNIKNEMSNDFKRVIRYNKKLSRYIMIASNAKFLNTAGLNSFERQFYVSYEKNLSEIKKNKIKNYNFLNNFNINVIRLINLDEKFENIKPIARISADKFLIEDFNNSLLNDYEII